MPHPKLTDHFYVHEFFGNPGQIDQPTQLQEYGVQILCGEVLEPLREFTGGWLKVTDGSREAPKYGSSTSQHLCRSGRTDDGRLWIDAAADINLQNNSWDNRLEVIRWLYDRRDTLPFSQVIWYPTTTHLHIGLKSARLAQSGRVQFKLPEPPKSGPQYPDVDIVTLIELDHKWRKK